MISYRLLNDEDGNLVAVERTDGRGSKVIGVNHRQWQEYLEWVEDGNTADPMHTIQEEADIAISNEIGELRGDLKKVIASQFEMMLAMFEVGKANGAWVNTDFDQALRQKAATWKTKLDRLRELGDDA